MKRFLAILLAMMLALVSVVALAEGGTDTDPNSGNTEPVNEGEGTEGEGGNTTNTDYVKDTPYDLPVSASQTITIQKIYTITIPDAVKDDPDLLEKYSLSKDKLTFTVEGRVKENTSSVEVAPEVSVEKLEFAETSITEDDIDDNGNVTKEFPITINIPSYSEVGIYEYTITEDTGDEVGVGYHTSPLYLKITVIRNTQGNLVIGGIAIRDTNAVDEDGQNTGEKIDTLENTYGAGRLAVTKEVAGNSGDQEQDFDITVTFTSAKEVGATISFSGADNEGELSFTKAEGETSYTASTTITIHHGETVHFENIPAGVSYTVVEDTSEGSAYEVYEYNDVSYTNQSAAIEAGGDITAKVTNTKDIVIDTGIELETLPYVMIMVLALAGAALLVVRRRREQF